MVPRKDLLSQNRDEYRLNERAALRTESNRQFCRAGMPLGGDAAGDD